MAEELNLDNIQEYPSGFDLFNDPGTGGKEEAAETTTDVVQENEEKGNEKDTSAEVIIRDEDLFPVEGAPESVGGGKENEVKEDVATTEQSGEGSSAGFYSSIANAIRNDGILQHLEDDELASITSADDFSAAIDMEVNRRFSLADQELREAKGYGANVGEMAELQNIIGNLQSINPDDLANDSDERIANLRGQLISGYYQSLGMTPEQAAREVKKSMDAGTDIEDAKTALEQQLNFFGQRYNGLMNEARTAEENRRKEIAERQKSIVEAMRSKDGPFKTLRIDRRVRERAVENMYVPSVKGYDGQMVTKLQDFQERHPDEFLMAVGLLFTATDGFTDFSKLSDAAVRSERNASIKNLENVLRGQQGGGSGLRHVNNGSGNTRRNDSGPRYTILT